MPASCYPHVPLQDAFDAMVADVLESGMDLGRIAVDDRLARGFEPLWLLRIDTGQDRGNVAVIDAPHGQQWWTDEEYPTVARALAVGRRHLLRWIEREAEYIARRDGVPFTGRRSRSSHPPQARHVPA